MTRSAVKIERRSRAEIDRNYFFGDVLLRTGVAVGVVIFLIAGITPFSWRDALNDGLYAYLTLMTLFGLVGVLCLLAGRALRRNATHWDIED